MTFSRIAHVSSWIGCAILAVSEAPLSASTYGTLCNFDTVNTTGEECHGFEIELEDCHSSDITRTYNYNHYGVPRIYDDTSDPAHVRCIIRWESAKNPDGSWASYTAIPSGPIDPTNGHQFTNPNVNFGGEHFGVSYRVAPTTARYFWLVDRTSALVRGPEVKISTPTFIYNPPAGGAPANVVARIEPPEPAEVHRDEFGPATWVRSIKTTSHNNHHVELRDLRSDDPDDENDVNWQNGEPDEVEVEWHLLQEEFDKDGVGKGGELEGGAEALDEGDEIVTRRWEFYEYSGPFDPENHEAIADRVADDDLHGVGTKVVNDVEYDLENTVVVGEYLGSQMAAFDVDPELSLCDHLEDGEVGVPYPDRPVVAGGNVPFTASSSGDLPAGMSFDAITGLLSGTPTESGEFAFTVEASDTTTPAISRTYKLRVAAAGAALAPQWTVEATVAPGGGGSASGSGTFDGGSNVTLVATPKAGYRFAAWTELGIVTSRSPRYQLPVDLNHQLVAVFHPVVTVTNAPAGQLAIEWPADAADWTLQESGSLDPSSWANSTRPSVDDGGTRRVTVDPTAAPRGFFRLRSH